MEQVKLFLAGLVTKVMALSPKTKAIVLAVIAALAATAFVHQNPERFSPAKEKVVSALSAVEHKVETVTHDVTTECRDGLLTIDGTVVNDGIGNPVACSCQVVLD